MNAEDRERYNWLADRAQRLIEAAIAGDADEAPRLVEEIGTTYGHDGVYSICFVLSETIRVWVFPNISRGDGSLTGDMLSVERDPNVPVDRCTEWACRFVVAYVNGDTATTEALFFGQTGDRELLLGGVASLVGLVGGVGRQKMQETAGRE